MFFNYFIANFLQGIFHDAGVVVVAVKMNVSMAIVVIIRIINIIVMDMLSLFHGCRRICSHDD